MLRMTMSPTTVQMTFTIFLRFLERNSIFGMLYSTITLHHLVDSRQMYELRTKRRMRQILYGPFTVLILTGLLVVSAMGAWGMRAKSEEARSKRDDAAEELKALQARKIDVSADVLRLSTDRGIEGEIRKKYMVAKEGEKVMILTDSLKELKDDDPGFVPDPPTLWEKLLGAIGVE